MTTYNKQDPATIQAMFDSIAKQYDRTNGVLSFQLHRSWNRSLIKNTLAACQPKVLLDLCCGTGAIAFEYLQNANEPTHAYMLDFSEGMLAHAKSIAGKLNLDRHRLDFLQADAQKIPLPANTIDCATIAYGIRNVKEPKLCIDEVYRVLRTGGIFGILELTQPQNKMLRLGHHFYLRTVLPVMGKFLTSNQDAYRYLCNSIHTFVQPSELEKLLRQAGFQKVERRSLFGGIATLLLAVK